ncbi:MAG TPA: cysteine peptidase family C39 domain-containing protein [Blastocatellia bacterium]|nr:cysteine peptidase family C39 domain-containing protein [Blastocatellia bacterium]
MKRSKPPFYKQETPDSCGPACLRMVLSHFNLSVSEAELRARCDCTIFGADPPYVVDVARQLGFSKTDIQNLSPDELQSILAEGLYPIVYVSLLPIDASEGSQALVALDMDVDIDDGAVTVYDPDHGERVLPLGAFLKAWELKRNLAIIVDK